MKRFISFFVILAMTMLLFCVNVFAEGEHIHDGVVFTAWSDTTSLPSTSGSYYLTADVELTDTGDTWNVPSGEVNLCLNGHRITSSSYRAAIHVYSGGALNIYDCSDGESGTIAGANECIDNSGTLTVNGGTLQGSYSGIKNTGTAAVYGGSVSGDDNGIDTSGTLTVNGGTINSGRYGIYNNSNYTLSSTVTVISGTINGGEYGIYNIGDTVTVYDGIITGDSCGIYNMITNSTLIVNGGTISGIKNTGTLAVNGGTISSFKYGMYSYGIYNSSGDVTVNSGDVSGIYNTGTLAVNDGTISGTQYGIDNSRGEVTVNSGAVSGDEFGIYNYKGKVTVNSGALRGDKCGIHTSGDLYLSGSTEISGTEADINLDGNTYITVTGKLENAEPYTVKKQNYGVITNTDPEKLVYNDPIKFASAVKDYKVSKNDDGQLELSADLHEHNGVVFKAWRDTASLPYTSGNYYLDVDVQLNDTWKPLGEVNLCLNGHVVKYVGDNDSAIEVSYYHELNIYDCSENESGAVSGGKYSIYTDFSKVTVYGGTITGDSCGIYNHISGTATVNGGTVNGDDYGIYNDSYNDNTVTVNGGTINSGHYGIYNSRGDVTINGGTVRGEKIGIYIDRYRDYSGQLNLSGDAEISGGEADIYLKEKTYFAVTGKLENAKPYAVKSQNNSVITNTDSKDLAYNDPEKFVTPEQGVFIIKNGDGQLMLFWNGVDEDAAIHRHDDIEFKAWVISTRLPSEPGNYYLTVDVQLVGTWYPLSGDVNLCLNGHTITYNSNEDYGSAIHLNNDSTLSIYDCSENGSGAVSGGYYCIYIGSYDSTLNIYGVTVSGNSCGILNSIGTLNVYGGAISGGEYGIDNRRIATVKNGTISGGNIGIYNWDSLYLSGDAEISGEEADIMLYASPKGDASRIIVIGKLENTRPYTVFAYGNEYMITNTASENLVFNDITKFEAAKDGYIIIKKSDGQLYYVIDDGTYDKTFTKGDINGDGTVNITDAIELLKYVAKLDNNVVNEAGTDVDGNGTVNINDAIYLLKMIAKLI